MTQQASRRRVNLILDVALGPVLRERVRQYQHSGHHRWAGRLDEGGGVPPLQVEGRHPVGCARPRQPSAVRRASPHPRRRPHDRCREAAGAVRGIHHRAADGHVGQGGPRRGSGEERAFAGPAVPGGAPGDGTRFRVAHRGAGGARRQHPNRSSARVQRGHRAVGEPLGQPHVPFRHRRGAACARRLLPARARDVARGWERASTSASRCIQVLIQLLAPAIVGLYGLTQARCSTSPCSLPAHHSERACSTRPCTASTRSPRGRLARLVLANSLIDAFAVRFGLAFLPRRARHFGYVGFIFLAQAARP